MKIDTVKLMKTNKDRLLELDQKGEFDGFLLSILFNNKKSFGFRLKSNQSIQEIVKELILFCALILKEDV